MCGTQSCNFFTKTKKKQTVCKVFVFLPRFSLCIRGHLVLWPCCQKARIELQLQPLTPCPRFKSSLEVNSLLGEHIRQPDPWRSGCVSGCEVRQTIPHSIHFSALLGLCCAAFSLGPAALSTAHLISVKM